jgi:hypothetical protein
VTSVKEAAVAFWELPAGEKADAVYKGVIGVLAGGGSFKAAGGVGRLANLTGKGKTRTDVGDLDDGASVRGGANTPNTSRINYSQRLLDDSFDPIPFDQGVLDHVVQIDPALSNVRLSARPQISADLPDGTFGLSRQAFDWETNTFTDISEIGPIGFRNRNTLIGTLIHEETHLRFGHRLSQGNERYLRMDSLGIEESYVQKVEERFLRMQKRAGR